MTDGLSPGSTWHKVADLDELPEGELPPGIPPEGFDDAPTRFATKIRYDDSLEFDGPAIVEVITDPLLV